MRKRILLAVAALVLAASTVLGTFAFGASSGTGAGKEPIELNLAFQASGPIARIYVRPGDHVRKGDLLAELDSALARTGVESAEAGVMSARAALLALTEGLSPSERAQDEAALAQALAAVDAAAQERADVAAGSHQNAIASQAAVDQARSDLATARAALAADRARLEADQRKLASAQAALGPADSEVRDAKKRLDSARAALRAAKDTYYEDGCTTPGGEDPATCAADQKAIDDAQDGVADGEERLADAGNDLASAEARVSDAQAAVTAGTSAIAAATDAVRQARDALTTAANANNARAVADSHAVHQAGAAHRAAKLAVRSTRASNAAAAQPPRPSELLQARAGLRAALAALNAARVTLAQTQLRAPADGIIVTVRGHVGEMPGQTTDSPLAAAGGGRDSGTGGSLITMITYDASVVSL